MLARLLRRGHVSHGVSCCRASPNGLPSVSLQIAHASPGWITVPPSSRTRSTVSEMSATTKYGRLKESPGPRPRSWMPTAGVAAWVCQPLPSAAARASSSTPRSAPQKRRARAGSSAGNSIRESDGLDTRSTISPAVDRANQALPGVSGRVIPPTSIPEPRCAPSTGPTSVQNSGSEPKIAVPSATSSSASALDCAC